MEKKNHIISLLHLFLENVFELYNTRTDLFVNRLFIKRVVAVRFLSINVIAVMFLWSVINFFGQTTSNLVFNQFYSRKLGLALQKLWLCFISFCGDRCLIGTRRIALRGLFVKQRYVTRYNYKSYTQYLWRRTQRRARLFLMRRQSRFFVRRYKKFRRLRYSLSYHLGARVKRGILSFRFRRSGQYTRLFVRGFLFWRSLILNKARWKLKNSTIDYWKNSARFSLMRYGHRNVRAYKLQASLISQPRRKFRFLRSKRTNRLGFYNQLLRRPIKNNFYKRSTRLTLLGGIQKYRQFRLKAFLKTSVSTKCRLFSIMKFRHVRHYVRAEKNKLIRFKRQRLRRRRWPRPMWRFYRRRRKLIRLKMATFIIKRRRLHRRRILMLRKTRFFRRIKRRLKRRKKRRIRYFGRWARRYLSARRRKFRSFVRKRKKSLIKKANNVLKTRSIASDILFKLRSSPLLFLIQTTPSTIPLSNLLKFQGSWLKNRITGTSLSRFNRLLNRRYLKWVEDSIPRTANLVGFARYRRFCTSGRLRGWMKILFVKGKRLYYYRELKQPFAQLFIKRNLFSTLKYRTVTFNGSTIASTLVAQLTKKRYLRRTRFAFFRRRYQQKRGYLYNFKFRARFRRRRSNFRINWYKARSRRLFWGKQKQRRLRVMVRNRFSFYRYWFSRRRGILLLLRRQVLLRHTIFRQRYRTLNFFRRFSNWRFAIKRLRTIRKIRSRRVIERYLSYRNRRLFLFRVRFLQRQNHLPLVRIRQNLVFRTAFRQFLINITRRRKTRWFLFLLRRRFLIRFKTTLKRYLAGVGQRKNRQFIGNPEPAVRSVHQLTKTFTKNRIISNLLPVSDAAIPTNTGVRKIRSPLWPVSRYFMRHGFKSLNSHFLLTRRYPSVYDFETFNYLFESTFFYKKFIQMGKRWRSQILILSVLRYFRPYSSYHLIRFIKKFLVEGFPIFFEMSSLKQSNKEQPFPVPINLTFFQNYMLKALVTRFRAKRHSVCFQAALLLELWAWHVDPTVSILHEFLMNHYALGLDSRFFVHYRWRVNR